MGKLVDNDAGLQVTIPVRGSSVPKVHPAATVLTVRWGHKIGIVESAAILSIGNDTVVFLTAPAEVVLLEVARCLVESVARCAVSHAVSLIKAEEHTDSRDREPCWWYRTIG